MVGPFGAGSKLKYIANLLVAIHIVGAAEAIVLGEKVGLDPAILVEVLADSAATSRMLEVRGPSMATSAIRDADDEGGCVSKGSGHHREFCQAGQMSGALVQRERSLLHRGQLRKAWARRTRQRWFRSCGFSREWRKNETVNDPCVSVRRVSDHPDRRERRRRSP